MILARLSRDPLFRALPLLNAPFIFAFFAHVVVTVPVDSRFAWVPLAVGIMDILYPLVMLAGVVQAMRGRR